MGGKGGGGFLGGMFSRIGTKRDGADPAGLFHDLKVDEEKPPPDTEAIAAAAEARERERKRLASYGRPTILSGRRTDALSASIGKRTLGGA